jgi:hypothetical protein
MNFISNDSSEKIEELKVLLAVSVHSFLRAPFVFFVAFVVRSRFWGIGEGLDIDSGSPGMRG